MHRKLEERYRQDEEVVLLHVQTVFEGEAVNTPETGIAVVRRHGVEVPVAYDAHVDGHRTSVLMHRYGTGGTPWTIVIDRAGKVRFNGFTPADAAELAKLITRLRAEEPPKDR